MVKFDFDPSIHSPALNPNGGEEYKIPHVVVQNPHTGERMTMRWDNAQDLIRFGTVGPDGKKKRWLAVRQPNLPKTPAAGLTPDGVTTVSAEEAPAETQQETKAPDSGKLAGLRIAAGLLGIQVDPRWGVKRLETLIAEKAGKMSEPAPTKKAAENKEAETPDSDVELPPNGGEGDGEDA